VAYVELALGRVDDASGQWTHAAMSVLSPCRSLWAAHGWGEGDLAPAFMGAPQQFQAVEEVFPHFAHLYCAMAPHGLSWDSALNPRQAEPCPLLFEDFLHLADFLLNLPSYLFDQAFGF
jgi:hypothetical protein